MAQHDDSVIEPATAYFFTAAVGSPAPTPTTVTGFDSSNPNAIGGGTNEVQTATISGNPTGGTFTLTFGASNTTTALPYNASALTVQNALVALQGIDPGDVFVTGPVAGAYTITFGGQYAATDVQTLTAAHTLTGGSAPAVAVTTTTPGATGTMTGWKFGGHTDLDDDFEADQDGGDSEVRGTRQVPNLRERVEQATEFVGLNLVQLDRDGFGLYYGGGTPGNGFYDAPDTQTPAELAVLVIYIDGTSNARRIGEYHPKCSVRSNGAISREAEGFMKLPIRYTPLKLTGQPVTRWIGPNVGM